MSRSNKRGRGKVASAEIANAGTTDEKQPVVEAFQGKKLGEPRFTEEMEDLLETPFYSLHKTVPAFQQEQISMDPRHWVVQWFFPNAPGGPVYVDYPRNKADLEICKKKAVIMDRLKLTYKLFRPQSQHQLMQANDAIAADGADFNGAEVVF